MAPCAGWHWSGEGTRRAEEELLNAHSDYYSLLGGQEIREAEQIENSTEQYFNISENKPRWMNKMQRDERHHNQCTARNIPNAFLVPASDEKKEKKGRQIESFLERLAAAAVRHLRWLVI